MRTQKGKKLHHIIIRFADVAAEKVERFFVELIIVQKKYPAGKIDKQYQRQYKKHQHNHHFDG
jgi:hypothetical protein